MTDAIITTAERRARVVRRHLLGTQAAAPSTAAVADALVVLHSSDPASVYLSALSRLGQPSTDDVSAELYERRGVIRHHGMRRTVWVGTPEVIRLVHTSSTAAVARNEWRILHGWVDRSGIADAATWIDEQCRSVLDALHRLGPMSARQLGKAVPELTRKLTIGTGKYVGEAAAHTRILQNLGFDGRIVRGAPTGSWISSEYTWHATEDWLPGGIDVSGDEAAARAALVGRYLDAFGPATTDDIVWWGGWTKAGVRAALDACGAMQVTLDDGSDGEVAWVRADDVQPTPELSPQESVALLPGLDPTGMGWKQRRWYLGEHTAFGGPLFDRNGNIGPTVWAAGRVVGAWAQGPDGAIVWELLEPVDAATRRAIATAADRLHTALDGTIVTPRFPTPLQRTLSRSGQSTAG